jgi:hypothetical protein
MKMIRKLKRYPMHYSGVKQTHPNITSGMPFSSGAVVVGNIVFLNSFDGRSMETGKVTSDKFEEQQNNAGVLQDTCSRPGRRAPCCDNHTGGIFGRSSLLGRN